MAVSVNANEQLNGTLELSVDKATGETVFVLNGVEETNLTTDAEFGNGDVKYFTDEDTVSYSALGVQGDWLTLDGNRIFGAKAQSDDAIAVLTIENVADTGALVLERLSDTAVPEFGNAEMSGDYFGYWQTGDAGGHLPSQLVLNPIIGDAKLTVDFANSMVSGAITNRSLRNLKTNAPGSQLTDVILEDTSIDGFGGFSGTATGGRHTSSGFDDATVTGSFVGLLTRSQATGAIGAVEIITNDPEGQEVDGVALPRDRVETGIFSVSE
ncbi:hypothetical protein FHS72_001568 [Loktanella ponticola]|uniref:Uncharacterized protein n=1 Tax=Yoonia ponticola TaxID=1524255 RepID=A0A7W9EXS4_9RHOB|nr:hypothetical protein [Yoonia ponticola]MBB5721944.1 hypothetical protein [Yoonia ponticola]